MDDFGRWVAGGIIAAVIGVLKMIWSRVSRMEASMNHHKLYAAETYATKEDLNRGIDRIMDKLEKILDKLDRKVDK